MFLNIVDQMQIQFDKGFEFQLHPGFAKSHFGNLSPGNSNTKKDFEKFFKFVLIRTVDKIDQKCN
jgi:hypothetical protein